jgi:enoyl-CoA hydratase
MNSHTTIALETLGHTAMLTFNRPEVLNALSTTVATETLDALRSIGSNPDVRVLILTGAGRAFIAGADIAEMEAKTAEEARIYSELGHTCMNTLQDLPQPVIAAINGFCLGGGLEVALACDIRIAAASAQFGLPETILGIIPGWGATQRTARLVGTAKTKEMIFTGARIKAPEALSIGLVNRVVPDEGLMSTVREMAELMCRQGQAALRQAKTVINRGIGLSLEDALRLEIDTFVKCFDTADRREGMRAFIEKRKPVFTGA